MSVDLPISVADLARRAATLRALHVPGNPLLLANVWDVASARVVAGLGFPALATSSHAVADALGCSDNDTMAPDDAFGVVRRIAAVLEVPLTADLEAGYQLAPKDFVERLLAAGAVGCNLEDTDHHGGGTLVPMEAQAERLAAVKQAARAEGVDIVINARVDTFVRRGGDAAQQMEEGVRRGRAYLAAGADCIYPIVLSGEDRIGEFVQQVAGPVNILFRPGALSVADMKRLNVARLSLAGSLHQVALAAAKERAEALLAGAL
ncbi:MAG TPA: isocitrate lyase/phosphoenolpyruvate mutase family protein [Chloroflexota bacterium]|nr:isocitrate lyase/phosphoenolpyruvate mutase family protein [Chloroflexota bacterium]